MPEPLIEMNEALAKEGRLVLQRDRSSKIYAQVLLNLCIFEMGECEESANALIEIEDIAYNFDCATRRRSRSMLWCMTQNP